MSSERSALRGIDVADDLPSRVAVLESRVDALRDEQRTQRDRWHQLGNIVNGYPETTRELDAAVKRLDAMEQEIKLWKRLSGTVIASATMILAFWGQIKDALGIGR